MSELEYDLSKDKNKRIIPTNNKILMDKEFNMEVYMKLQVESNWNDIDIHRYIDVDNINFSQWSRELNIDSRSIKKHIKYLLEIGILRILKGRDGFDYYKIKGWYDNYSLFEESFIRKLLNIKNKNLIKVYLIYYNYSRQYGSCKLTQDKILEGIGLSPYYYNKHKLREINLILLDLGLINIQRVTEFSHGSVKTTLEIIAPKYSETKFNKSTAI